MSATRPSLSLPRKLLYAAGQGGNVLGDTLIQTFLLRFYLPPDGKGPELFPETWLGLIPVWLGINVIARIVDSIADPLVASWSDKSRHRLGRRRVFMLWGVAPLAIATAVMFFPPSAEHEAIGNAGFLVVLLCSYFFFFTVYVSPYLALLPEIGKTATERLDLSTFQAIAALIGAAIASMVGPILFFSADGARADIQSLAIFCGVTSLILMVLPILAIDEPKLVAIDETTASPPLMESLKSTLGDPHFRFYLVGTVLFFFGFNIIRAAAPYYVEVSMGQTLDQVPIVMGATFGVAGLSFPLVNLVARKIGKRKTMMLGTAVLIATMSTVPFVSTVASGFVLMGVSGIGVAVLLAIPNALLSDICAANAMRTGKHQEAMFFGAQGFFLKVNLGVSLGLLGMVLELGKSVSNPVGVQASGPLAAIALALALAAFWRYQDPPEVADGRVGND